MARPGLVRLLPFASVLGLVIGSSLSRPPHPVSDRRPLAVWVHLDGSRSAADVRDALSGRGRIRVHSRWLDALSIQTTSGDTAAIAGMAGVAAVRPVAVARGAAVDPARRVSPPAGGEGAPSQELGDQYGNARAQLDLLGVPDAHAAGLTGRGIRIAILDTGFRRDHESLARLRLVAQRDFLQGDLETQNEPGESAEQQEHGTLCWSACGGFAPGMHMGPAHGAEFLLAKTEDPGVEFVAEEDWFVAALEWADSMRADIVSSSLVFQSFIDAPAYEYEDLDGETAAATRAMDLAAARGMLCFQGAGNAGPLPGSIVAPSDADSIVACGAVDLRNRIAPFSSRGPTADGRTKPEITAPGVGIWSADAVGTRTYARFDGTSLSTPLSAGVAALVWEAHPEWSAMDLRDALLATADRADRPDDVAGHGTIDAMRAVRRSPIRVPGPFSGLEPAGPDSVDPGAVMFRWQAPRLAPEGDPPRFEVWIDDALGIEERIVLADVPDTVATLAVPLRARRSYRWMVWAVSEEGFRRGSRDWLAFVTGMSNADPDGDGEPAGLKLRIGPIPSRGMPSISVFVPGESGAGMRALSFALLDVAGHAVTRGIADVSPSRWVQLDDVIARGGVLRIPSGIYWLRVSGDATTQAAAARLVLIR